MLLAHKYVFINVERERETDGKCFSEFVRLLGDVESCDALLHVLAQMAEMGLDDLKLQSQPSVLHSTRTRVSVSHLPGHAALCLRCVVSVLVGGWKCQVSCL
jgi:hypothetical protein